MDLGIGRDGAGEGETGGLTVEARWTMDGGVVLRTNEASVGVLTRQASGTSVGVVETAQLGRAWIALGGKKGRTRWRLS